MSNIIGNCLVFVLFISFGLNATASEPQHSSGTPKRSEAPPKMDWLSDFLKQNNFERGDLRSDEALEKIHQTLKEKGILPDKAQALLDLAQKDATKYERLIAVLQASRMDDKQLLAEEDKLKAQEVTPKGSAIQKEISRRALVKFKDETQFSDLQKRDAFRKLIRMLESVKNKPEDHFPGLAKEAATNREANLAYRTAFMNKGADSKLTKMAQTAFDEAFSSEVKTAVEFKELYDLHGQKHQAFQDATTKNQFLAACIAQDNCYSDLLSKPGYPSENLFDAIKKTGLSYVDASGDKYSFHSVDKKTQQLIFFPRDEDNHIKYEQLKEAKVSAEALGNLQEDTNGIGAFKHALNYYTWSATNPNANKMHQLFLTNSAEFELLDENGKKVQVPEQSSSVVVAYDTRSAKYRLIPTAEIIENGNVSVSNGDRMVTEADNCAQWTNLSDGKVKWSDGKNEWLFYPKKQSPGSKTAYNVRLLPPPRNRYSQPNYGYGNWNCRT
ncbi:MAG: hypothetical protein HY537_01400 [Deltaproteobacteria bacterium]|nr:hypothetical protein [Deltaproteobacteria bacterium]